ncbi:hypothetical protein M5K25_027020 [Dendrobium thyrsiflorum]|uniref:Uncharacterized protein n=1 Tax=Dendrobium thyrsiflorum TaxID=117978 RepID=A0ABD0TYV8_DENTH
MGRYDSTEMTSQRWKEKPIPSGVARNLWAPKIRAPASARFLMIFKGTDRVLTDLGSGRMEGEWMMDPIKIPWFRHPGSSWSLVYLVRGGSRPNLTEGSLSAAMGCFVQGYLRAPSHNRLSCGAIWRQNRRLEDTYHVLTGKRMFENGSYYTCAGTVVSVTLLARGSRQD